MLAFGAAKRLSIPTTPEDTLRELLGGDPHARPRADAEGAGTGRGGLRGGGSRRLRREAEPPARRVRRRLPERGAARRGAPALAGRAAPRRRRLAPPAAPARRTLPHARPSRGVRARSSRADAPATPAPQPPRRGLRHARQRSAPRRRPPRWCESTARCRGSPTRRSICGPRRPVPPARLLAETVDRPRRPGHGARACPRVPHLGGPRGGRAPAPAGGAALASLHLPVPLEDFAELPHGLVLVCGATGSGKSTTLAALAQEALRRGHRPTTLEDPIEHGLSPERSLLRRRDRPRRARLRHRPARRAPRGSRRAPARRDARSGDHRPGPHGRGDGAPRALVAPQRLGRFRRSSASSTPTRPRASRRSGSSWPTRCGPSSSSACSRGPAGAGGSRRRGAAGDARRRLAHPGGKTAQLATAMQSGRREGMILLERCLADRVQAGEVRVEDARAASNDPASLATAPGPAQTPSPWRCRGTSRSAFSCRRRRRGRGALGVPLHATSSPRDPGRRLPSAKCRSRVGGARGRAPHVPARPRAISARRR